MPCPPPRRIQARLDEPKRLAPTRSRLARVDQHQLRVVLGLDLDLGLAGDGDAVARAGLDAVDRTRPLGTR